MKKRIKIIFLHHSTGKSIWLGGTGRLAGKLINKSDVKSFFKQYNKTHNTDYQISERKFPALSPYGWNNYPFDYYNIWVKNAGEVPYLEEPTLEILTGEYDVIIFKHCYDVSNIEPDTGLPDIDSGVKSLENYKLQYNALKEKMHQFPDTRFIIWTPAVFIKSMLSEDAANRTREFYRWMLEEWNEKGDNIYIWDFYKYETEGGLYMLDQYSEGPGNSHPGKDFARRLAPLFGSFITDVLRDNISS